MNAALWGEILDAVSGVSEVRPPHLDDALTDGRLLVTHAQYRQLLDASDQYENNRWRRYHEKLYSGEDPGPSPWEPSPPSPYPSIEVVIVKESYVRQP